MQNALEETQETIDEVDQSITPVVVQYVGNVSRTDGGDIAKYPLFLRVRFQDGPTGINLGFDDLATEEGIISGLHKYYGDNIWSYNNGRRITAWLKLEPRDIEPKLYPDKRKRGFQATHKIKVNDEIVRCRLEKINDYNNADGGSTKCVFIKD